jgi:ADP-ribosylglycohydrolase
MTLAIAQAILQDTDYGLEMKALGKLYPDAGYGGNFRKWIYEPDVIPYNSWGNGSAMRVSPVGYAFDDEDTVLKEAIRTAEPSHNHPEGIKGAMAVALAIFMARMGETKKRIKDRISIEFHYDLSRTLNDIRPEYSFDVSCQGTVPEAITAFLESSDYEDAVRKAVSLGGDSDTLACIAGGIAEAFYKKIPPEIIQETFNRLPNKLKRILMKFQEKYV